MWMVWGYEDSDGSKVKPRERRAPMDSFLFALFAPLFWSPSVFWIPFALWLAGVEKMIVEIMELG